METYTKKNSEREKLKKAQEILKVLGDKEGLLERFISYRKLLWQHSLLQDLKKELGVSWVLFETFDWEYGYSDGLLAIQTKIKSITELLENLKALRAYNDLDNESSLARWAVDQKRAFTKDEESALVHFATLGITRTKPSKRSGIRFLPEPQGLFNSLIEPVHADDTGFWLSLDGVFEYVEYVSVRILEHPDSQIIKLHFEQQTKSISEKIQEQQAELKDLNQLFSRLRQIENIEPKTIAYKNQDTLKNFREQPELPLTEEQFNEIIETLGKEQEIQFSFQAADKEFQDAKGKAYENTEAIKDLNEALGELEAFNLSERLLEEFNTLVSNSKVQSGILAIKSPKSPRELRQEVQQRKSMLLNKIQQRELIVKLNNAKKEESIALSKVELDEILITDGVKLIITLEELNGLQIEFEKAVSRYQDNFNNVVRNHVPENDRAKFKDNYDFLGLCHAILPKSFAALEFTEETIIQEVENHLKQIARKNQDLNERKFQRIRDLVEDVSTEISTRLDKVRRISRIFDNPDSEITGGHFVQLRSSFNSAYPRDWLTRFAEEFASQSGLFSVEDGLYNRVSKLIGVEEKLVEAFHACGGPSNVRPTASQLLDPNSYFELSFSMETKSGRKNAGSTGQTYAATALLCIARLSLLNPDEKNRAKGLRFMPVDEAEGIGTNYDMLMRIASQNDYQIISFSQRPLPSLQEGKQNIYFLQKNVDTDEKINLVPTAILGVI